MYDMLVKLYELPSLDAALDGLARRGISIRRTIAPEAPVVVAWVLANFPSSAVEVEFACARMPSTCFLALRDAQILGFACHEATARNFFGPEGVLKAERGRGVGRALLLAALHDQRAQGYAYAIIGGVGPAAFYSSCVGAVAIEGSDPGVYADMLRTPPSNGD